MAITLYGNCESGHSFKVKSLLEVAGVAHDYHEIDLRIPRPERPEPFRSLARYGEVPLLVHDGKAYVQSNAILLHMAEHLQAWGGESAERLERVREWLFWEANRVGMSLAHLRFGQKFDPAAYAGTVLPWFRARFDADMVCLDQELADGRLFLLDDRPTVADLSLSAYMHWPEQANVTYPATVDAWLSRIRALPGWRHPYEMPGADPW